MSRFKIGQKVVAIKDYPDGDFKTGDIVVVDGFVCCNGCGIPLKYWRRKGLVALLLNFAQMLISITNAQIYYISLSFANTLLYAVFITNL